MANSPRPGVIQLDHPNVYMAAKEAQKDDWLRRGINLTGDLAGEALQKRNQDIRYRRAAGLDEDRRTNGEVAGDLAKGTWEGVKKLGSGLASVGEGAWGLLKAPFTEDVVTEKSYEEGVKTERPLFQGEMSQEDPFSGGMSREQTMSLAEPEPSDAVAVSFPTTVVGKDRVVEPSRREVGGKVDWDFPNKGYKTEFPTTVVGAPSTLKAPSAQPVGQKAPETPQNDAGATNDKVPEGMLQSPNWSEMYHLDPERAKYDWTREREGTALALDAAKLAQEAGQASSLEELQQLWKDNTRALDTARKNQDSVGMKMYQDNIDRLVPLLQEKAPAVWGKAATPASAETDPATTGAGEGADGTTPKQRAHTEAYTQVDLLTDADKNGTIDNLLAVDRAIKGIRDKYGVSDADMQDVYAQVELAKSKAKEEKEARERDRQTALDNKLKNEAAARSGGAQDERAALLRINKLQKEPTPQNKSDAILWVMRKRSGAKIDPDEFLQYLKGGVDDATYAEITKDLSPSGISVWLGTLIDGKLSESQVRTITDKYAARVNPSFLTEDLGTFVDPNKLNKPPPGGGGGGGGKPKKLKTETLVEYMKRVDAWKAKGGK